MNNRNNGNENIFSSLDKSTVDAIKNGDSASLTRLLSSEDKKVLENLLSDKQKLKEILSSPEAQRLSKILGKKNGNG